MSSEKKRKMKAEVYPVFPPTEAECLPGQLPFDYVKQFMSDKPLRRSERRVKKEPQEGEEGTQPPKDT